MADEKISGLSPAASALPTYEYPVYDGVSGNLKVTGAQQKTAAQTFNFATGRIPFGASNTLASDANIIWDNTEKRLGIGPGAPLADIHISKTLHAGVLRVDGTDGAKTIINCRSLNSGTQAYMEVERFASNDYGFFSCRTALSGVDWYAGIAAVPSALNTSFSFKSNLQNINGNPIMVLAKTGNVGIGTGTTLPSATLQVNGIGIISGSPFGGAKGFASINCSSLYDNGLRAGYRTEKREVPVSTVSTTTDTLLAVTDTTTTLPIVSITRAGAIATATTSGNHNLKTGVNVLVAGADQPEYNGLLVSITVLSPTTFTYIVVGTPATPATGSITWIARVITLSNSMKLQGSNTAPRFFDIKDESGNAAGRTIQIVPETSGSIDGVSLYAITNNYGYVRLYTDGNDWFKTFVF